MRSSMSGFFPFISVPPHTSTSSSNNTIAPRASNSDLIHHAIFGSLSGWLLTLISALRSLILSFILFISVSGDISTSRSNTVGGHDTPPRVSELDFFASLHTVYAYLTGLLLTLAGIKYQGSSTDPFSEHPTLMMLFLISILVYIIALLTLRANHMRAHCPKLMVGVCHISGAVACELLLLVLVSPMRSLIINVSSLALIVMLVSCYTYISRTDGGEEQASRMPDDLEAPTTSTA